MSSTQDPYKQKNKEEPGTAEKIADLSAFVKSSKFGMMTTRAGEKLVSRAMAVAAQVCFFRIESSNPDIIPKT